MRDDDWGKREDRGYLYTSLGLTIAVRFLVLYSCLGVQLQYPDR